MSRTAKHMSRLLFSGKEQGIFIKVPLFTYGSVDGWPPCERCAVRMPSEAGPPGEGFFPHLETFVSKYLGAVLFFPWGEEILDSPPRSSSNTEALIPPVGMRNVWNPLLASLSLPSSSPDGT